MFEKPQQEHEWLNQLVGNWTFEHVCQMPDGKSNKTPGKMTCRMLGGLWLICESSGESDEGGKWSSIMSVGYDPKQNKYVGTFLGSMMTKLWLYEGTLDPSGKRLPLEAEGPGFDGSENCKYRDTIEIVDSDQWLFFSETMNDQGEWNKFMEGLHRRV